jgi:signal transduction histidine kinase
VPEEGAVVPIVDTRAVVTPEAPRVTDPPPPGTPSSRRRPGLGVRPRLVVWFLVLAGAALAGSAMVTNRALHAQIDDRVDLELRREAERFEVLIASEPVPDSNPGPRLRALLVSYLATTPVGDGQVLLAIVDGRPVAVSVDPRHRIDRLPEAVEDWSEAASGTYRDVGTPAGTLRSLALPVALGDADGVLVVGEFVGDARAEADELTRRIAAASACALLAAGLLAWGTAGRVLRPVRELARTAQAISDEDLSGRLAVEGHDETALMARTFNEMLDRLEGSLDAQRRLLRDVGHELRTPLTIIRGHLERLPDDPAERAESVELLLGEIDRLARVVSDLRLLAQADAPGFLTWGPVDAGDVVRDLGALASVAAPRDWQVGPIAEAVVVADRQRLLQALLNLVQNAVGATDEGDRIELSSRHLDGEVVFVVRDSGPGVPEGERGRIFERFARGQRGERGGTGLGLSIARAIALGHGGRLWLEAPGGRSGPDGGGATFCLAVPEDGRGGAVSPRTGTPRPGPS